jgi:metacaspase-1
VPFDYDTAGLITDDLLYRIVQQFKHFGAKILFISDSCHSGSVERLMFHPQYTGARTPRFFNPALYIRSPKLLEVAKSVEAAPPNPTSRTGAALLSGCRDMEVSWDVDFNGRANGAMTRAAIDAFRAYEPTDLTSWQKYILERIQAEQTPQVQGTYVQRRRTKFI